MEYMHSLKMTYTDAVKESVIRLMTRLSDENSAVNLSQGFPNEGPPWKLRMALAHGVLAGQAYSNPSDDDELRQSLIELIEDGVSEGKLDQLNQYSPPMGRPDVRKAISDYYMRFYEYQVSPDDITVTLGATEAFASALRTIGRPGDKCVIFEPFHELYPSQCNIFYLEPIYVRLKVTENNKWEYDAKELEEALKEAKILMFNTPHNPTGKVFTLTEMHEIVTMCLRHDVYIVTDEIYEHMCFDSNTHFLIPKNFPEIADHTLVCNSIGKSASATGWRLGWCLHPLHVRHIYRGIHDQIAVMSPHPMQYACLTYLKLPDEYFSSLTIKYNQRVKMLASALTEVGFQVVFPEGAYYLFVDYRGVPELNYMTPMEAAMYLLLQVGVACVPGDNFYGNKSGEARDYLRFAACRSEQDLEEAILRLKGKFKNFLP